MNLSVESLILKLETGEFYEVEQILCVVKVDSKSKNDLFFVKWKGHPMSNCTFEVRSEVEQVLIKQTESIVNVTTLGVERVEALSRLFNTKVNFFAAVESALLDSEGPKKSPPPSTSRQTALELTFEVMRLSYGVRTPIRKVNIPGDGLCLFTSLLHICTQFNPTHGFRNSQALKEFIIRFVVY